MFLSFFLLTLPTDKSVGFTPLFDKQAQAKKTSAHTQMPGKGEKAGTKRVFIRNTRLTRWKRGIGIRRPDEAADYPAIDGIN